MSSPSPFDSGSSLRSGSSYPDTAPPFRMVPRFLELNGTHPESATTARDRPGRSAGASPDRIVLEFDDTSSLYAPVWLSVRPYEVRGRWRLQVTLQFEDVVGLLVHRGVPLIWLTAQWDWVGRNVLSPASPRYLVDFLRPVEISPK